ncbi:MAG: hypothetical protein JXR33_05600 [Coriobacteriia bacterium]|nr:hypothetical protein [Coriobacteriia bacterium]
MDSRLYILGGLALFAVIMFAVAVGASVRYRRTVAESRRAVERQRALMSYGASMPTARPSIDLPAEPWRKSAEEALVEPTLEPEPEPELAPELTPEPEPEPETEPATLSFSQSPEIADYTLVAPVELHFTQGEGRVGVRPGTKTYAEFQRMAGVVLGDLERSHRS